MKQWTALSTMECSVPSTRATEHVTHCGDTGASSEQSETRKGFSANSLAIPKIIPSLLITHVSFTYQLC